MFYRICLTILPTLYVLDDPIKWQHGEVHAEYPKASGSFAPLIDLFMLIILGNPAPNISVIIETMTGSGCYQSL